MTKKYTIAIIDDKHENLRLLSTILKSEQYKIKASIDPDFAIESFKIEPPDLILLDIKMPLKDGYEVCQTIKSIDILKDVPIIFISALDDVESKVRAFKEGGVDYITKPFDQNEILARVKTQLELFDSRQSIQKLLYHQDFFLKKIIHDMNTPLSIISLNIESLEHSIGEHEQFISIQAASKTLSSIYSDLYYLTKKMKRIDTIQKLDITHFLASRIAFFYEMAHIKNIDIQMDANEEFFLLIDPYELERIVDNTLSNAIKYAYENSTIIIKIDWQILTFCNHGTEISHTNTIFVPYFQQTEKNIGLGLGLSIVKEICDKYAIDIHVQSENEITHFSYHFPRTMIEGL